MIGISNSGLDREANPLLSEEMDFDKETLNVYSMISANLMNFLPYMNHNEHRLFFNKFRQQQLLNGQDIQFFESEYPLAIEGWDKLAASIINQRGIIATYHFGPFQLINHLLMRAEIPYVLLVAGEVKADWETKYPRLLSRMDKAHANGMFQMLDANDRSSLRLLYQLLDKGFNLLIYSDGIEGLDDRKANRMAQLDFLGQTIHVPKGTALLAHRFDLPIYPCLLLRYEGRIKVEIGQTIYTADGLNLQHYAQHVADRIFPFLAKYVMHWPEQWTNWPMLHRFLLRDKPIGGAISATDDIERHFGLLLLDKESYLLEKKTYRLFPLDRKDYSRLKANWF